jgi:hypothetical protein
MRKEINHDVREDHEEHEDRKNKSNYLRGHRDLRGFLTSLRRRYYRITDFGSAVARAEARRLTELVRLARASGFVSNRA